MKKTKTINTIAFIIWTISMLFVCSNVLEYIFVGRLHDSWFLNVSTAVLFFFLPDVMIKYNSKYESNSVQD